MKRKHVKNIVGWVGEFSVGMVVGNVVGSTIPPFAGRFYRISSWIGGCVISGMLGTPIHRYTNRMVDYVCDEFDVLEEKHEPKHYPR